MGIKADSNLEIKDFSGMASNADPTDIPPGMSQVQINVSSIRRGQLEIRGGLRKVTFENED